MGSGLALPNLPSWLHPKGDDVLIDVIVSPRASRTRIMGVHDDRLKLQLAATPVDGRANNALTRFLATALGISRAQVAIVGGPASKRKTVRLCGVTAHKALVKLSPPRN